ncbi:MAG: LptF/LptG family permease [Nitrospinota bacterium]
MRILDKYILKELSKVFFLALFILTAILFLEKINFLADLILKNNVPVKEVIRLLLFFSPSFLTMTIPMSVLFASILTFSTLSTDNEIMAMRACGLGVYRLMVPVLILALLAYAGTNLITLKIQPIGSRMFEETMFNIMKSKTEINLKERVFNDFTSGLMIYVKEKDIETNLLHGLLIKQDMEGESPRYINADRGRFNSSVESKEVVLHLEDGNIHQTIDDEGKYRLINFKEYDLQLNFRREDSNLGGLIKGKREMSLAELKEGIEELKSKGIDSKSLEVEVHTKYALPFACFVFGLIGAPLGISLQRAGKGGGFGAGIMVMILNYMLLVWGQSVGEKGILPPAVSMWLPNLIMLSIGFIVLYRSAGDFSSFGITDLFYNLLAKVGSKSK